MEKKSVCRFSLVRATVVLFSVCFIITLFASCAIGNDDGANGAVTSGADSSQLAVSSEPEETTSPESGGDVDDNDDIGIGGISGASLALLSSVSVVSVRESPDEDTAPYSISSGVILDIPVKVGNSVILSNTFNDGTTIATVADMGDLIFRGNVDETEVGRLAPGMPMKITVGALENLSFDATLEYISPKAVENNGANQFEIKAAVSLSGGGRMRSGYSANAEIVLAQAKHVLTVPESAIEFSGDSTLVYVASGEGKERAYVRRSVETGLSDGVNIEVKSGLKAGDTVRGPQQVATDDN